MDQYRVVLIDDSEIVLAVMSRALTDAGFDVRAVSSLRKFVNAVLDWKPHVIVTDLHMPEMSGAALCSWVRTQIATAKTPVIICSSTPEGQLAKIAASVGADGYVSKVGGHAALPAKLRALCDEILF
ncbi:MAG TPA: response regulator [Kofleriaceae bacterium]|nr:response regulator [Kofleriaceae bacterium]